MTRTANKPSTVVLMNKREADEICQKINLSMRQAEVHGRKAGEAAYEAGLLLTEYREREGWRVQGYASFADGALKEFAEFATSKSQVSRLTKHAEIVNLLGEVVSTATSRALATVPPEERQAVFESAHGNGAGEVQKTATATNKRAAEAHEPKSDGTKSDGPAKAPAAKAKTGAPDRYGIALERIGDVCGKGVAKAIKDNTLSNVDPKGALYWASLKDNDMALIQELVVTKRWKPQHAFGFLSRVPDASTRISDLHNITVAQAGASLVVIGAMATITLSIRKFPEEFARIKKMLQLDK